MAALVSASVSGCDSRPADDPKSKLVGTWQEEFEFRGAQGHLVLVLGEDRKFIEQVALVEPDGRKQVQEYVGEWSFDGIKFTRRYLQENGRQYSGAKLRFASLDLTSVTSKEIVGKDNLRGVEVIYRRAEEGTLP
jgi:hypothetical protein